MICKSRPIAAAIMLILLAGCSENEQPLSRSSLAHSLASGFPLELASIPLSQELAQHLDSAMVTFQKANQDDPRFAKVVVRDQLILDIERPETRQKAGDDLYRRWQNDPTDFLWASTAIRYEYLLNRQTERDQILATAALNDTLTAAGSFAYALTHYSYGSRGRFYHRASQKPGLSPLNRLLLLRKTAMVESRQGRHFAAVRQLLQALPEVRQIGGPRLETRYWSSIALYLQRADRLDDAVHAVAIGLHLADQTDNKLYQGLLRKKLAGLLRARQEHSAALSQYQSTVNFARQENLPWVTLDALDKAASLSSSLGRPTAALLYDRQTLAHSLAMGDSLNAPRNMMNIADDFLQMGALDSCLVYQQRARLWVDHYPNQQNQARLPFQQAEYYCHIGQYDTVDSLLTFATDQSTSSGLALDEANILLGLINRGLEMSQPHLAHRSLKRLQQLRPVIFDQQPDQNVLADLELAAADLNMALGEFQPARLALDHAWQAIVEGGVVQKQWHYHQSAGQLAALRGDFSAAGQEFSQGFELAQQSGNPGRQAESQLLLGRILLLEGKVEEARNLFVDADQDPDFGGSFRTRLTNMWFQGRSWRQAGNYQAAQEVFEKAVVLSTPYSPSDVMAGIHLDLGRSHLAQNHLNQAKVNFDRADLLLAKAGSHSEDGSLTSFLDDTHRQLSEARIAWHLRGSSSPHNQDSVIKALVEANKAVLLGSMGPDISAASDQEILALTTQPGCYGLYFLGKDQSYFWVGNQDGWKIEILPGRLQIKELAGPVLADLHQPDRQPDALALAELGELLLGPIVSIWQPEQNLTLVTDGLLNNIPWSALIIPGTKSTTVLKHGPIAESPGWMSNKDPKKEVGSPSRSLLAIGFNGSPDGNDRLLNAEKEARLVAEDWTAGPVNLLVGPEASLSEEVLRSLSEMSVLHLASHARVREGWASESFLLLADEEGHSSVTAESIRELSWPGELVFLSSCEAGRTHRSGQGIMGLAGAFLAAGVDAVLSSSAKVDDEAGLYLARRFYHHWSGEKSRAAALRAAQLDMIANHDRWSHPFFWSHYRLIQR